MWLLRKRSALNLRWRIFFIAFTIAWLAWCFYVVASYESLSVLERIFHIVGIAILSPDLDTLLGRKNNS